MIEAMKVRLGGREFCVRPEAAAEMSEFFAAFDADPVPVTVEPAALTEIEDLPAEIIDGRV
jgi:hypothetical protein